MCTIRGCIVIIIISDFSFFFFFRSVFFVVAISGYCCQKHHFLFSNTLALTLLVTPDKQRIWKRNDDEYKDDRNQHERNILIYIFFFPSSLSLSSSSSSVILCVQQRKSRTNISKSDYNHTYTNIHARAHEYSIRKRINWMLHDKKGKILFGKKRAHTFQYDFQNLNISQASPPPKSHDRTNSILPYFIFTLRGSGTSIGCMHGNCNCLPNSITFGRQHSSIFGIGLPVLCASPMKKR